MTRARRHDRLPSHLLCLGCGGSGYVQNFDGEHTASEKVTVAECLVELDREIAVRRRVYPKWIADGKLSKDDAQHRIAVMEALREWLPATLFDRRVFESERSEDVERG